MAHLPKPKDLLPTKEDLKFGPLLLEAFKSYGRNNMYIYAGNSSIGAFAAVSYLRADGGACGSAKQGV